VSHALWAGEHNKAMLCVGIDPSAKMLEASGLPDTPDGLDRFVAGVMEVLVAEQVQVIKPQVAFFERLGLAGMKALAELMAAARAHEIFVIADAKRGDIGSSVAGYAEAWLTPGGDFESDALTLHPYHGAGSLDAALDTAVAHQKTVFVLVATSNPEAWPLQSAVRANGESVASGVLSDLVARVGEHSQSWPSLGIVVGATVDHQALGLNLERTPSIPILAPGYGAQGAQLSDVGEHFPHSNRVFPVSARALFDGGLSEFHRRYRQSLSVLGAQWES
jgi:orotidine-5'-phosphate decarboxylase